MSQGLFSAIEKNKRLSLKRKEFYKTKEGKKIQKEYSKRYLEKNKKKIKQVREEIREIRKEKGLCLECGEERENKKFKTCSKCREYYRNYYKMKGGIN